MLDKSVNYNRRLRCSEKQKYFSGFNVHMSKQAFDKISRLVLKLKPERFGIYYEIINRMSNFLNDKRQQVLESGALPTLESMKNGVLKGTVLGHLLFYVM